VKYAILPSSANEAILSYLGVPYEKTPTAIVFDGDIERDLRRIAHAIVALGYAHDDAYALQLASSFFLNCLER
jgi:hypothetical protein